MSRVALALAAAALVAAPGCLGAPSEESVGCVRDSDCGACAACRNGVCVAAPELPLCVDETEDPCNGVDDDQNGLVDDPEACWAPVWAFSDPSGAACFSSSRLAPPAICAGATARAGDAPAFTLAARPLPGLVPLRQCSRDGDHVLVAELPLFPAVPGATETRPALWTAAGWDCEVLLGWAYPAEPALHGATTPFGAARAVARWYDPATDRYGVTIGAASPPAGVVCDPRFTLWAVGEGPTSEAGPAPACALAPCRRRPSAVLVSQTPENGVVMPAGRGFPIRWTVRNDGDREWPPARWYPLLTPNGGDNPRGVVVTVGPGATYVLEAFAPSQEPAVDLVERWELRDAVEPLLTVELHFSTTPRRVQPVTVAPGLSQTVAPGARGAFSVALRNVADEPLPGAHLAVDGDLPVTFPHLVWNLATTATATAELAFTAPEEMGRYTAAVRLLDQDGHDVAILGAALPRRALALTVDVAGDTRGAVLACAIPDDAVVPPNARFYQACLVENVGATAWAPGWYAERAGFPASEPPRAVVDRAVAPGERAVLALPMVARSDDPVAHRLRVGWTLHLADGAVLPVTWPDRDGGTGYGARDGAWLWTDVEVGDPCHSEDPP
ncbi:MAG: hypothetical protein H6745_20650 [Deltaproteobacteria bacterium]|nr:hypothetical protein [Deltaproteobacteria bacterium]